MAGKPSKYDKRYLAAVDAAAAVFAEKGYHGANTVDIANLLDIKQGSLYYYFRSKEEALEAVCLQGITWQVSNLQELLDQQLPLARAIAELLRYNFQSLTDRADYMIVFNDDRQAIPLERRGRIREQSVAYHGLLEQLFTEAQAKGDVREELDPRILVRALTGLISSVFSWYHQKNELDMEKISEQYCQVFLAGCLKS
ncbi:TetR/AcrR family transcriptional regulator [Halioxenophilus sp. WMMB6]|uniref:TetR/AcrR family transcriptional regulator n=1 Tax=Halioxenophilus sp. WMMB6 TaxID=3073815 RepID=UPI00295F155D|nr:TetR/AcrR family transcriptional regulator [Halioxenophilus sp. WMMB6]